MAKLVTFKKDVAPYGVAGDTVALTDEQLEAVKVKVEKYDLGDAYKVGKTVDDPENAEVEEQAKPVDEGVVGAEARPKTDEEVADDAKAREADAKEAKAREAKEEKARKAAEKAAKIEKGGEDVQTPPAQPPVGEGEVKTDDKTVESGDLKADGKNTDGTTASDGKQPAPSK